jgi:hypothetical protein
MSGLLKKHIFGATFFAPLVGSKMIKDKNSIKNECDE